MTNDKGQAGGPKDEPGKKAREPKPYPQVRADDAIEPETPLPERQSFDPADERRLGPGGDPAEGKP